MSAVTVIGADVLAWGVEGARSAAISSGWVFAAQQALLQLQAQSTQNLATLYKVLGGGWK